MSAFTDVCIKACVSCLLLLGFSPAARAMPLRPDLVAEESPSGVRELNEALSGAITPSVLEAAGVNTLPKEHRLTFERADGVRPANLRVLVILVEFPNLPAKNPLDPVTYYDSKLFGREPWNTKTLRSFYLANSYGKLELTGEVFGWYTLPNASYYYAAASAGVCDPCYPRNARQMAEDAIELARADVDFSEFDNDGPDGVPSSGDDDGFVDAIFVVHSGPTYEETGNVDYVVSHQWTTSAPVSVNGVYAYVYATVGESSPLGTFCHEMGHVLGLPDLYDRDYSSHALDLWSLMAAGGWLDEGRTPSNLDAYCKMKLGFAEPVVFEDNVDGVTLRQVEQYPDLVKLWKNGRPGKEYYLLENRQRTGFDYYLPSSGLLIYHVDETVPNNDSSPRYMVGLEQADGLFELEGRVPGEPYGADPGDPFPGWSYNRNFSIFTTPSSRSNDGVDVEVSVTSITDSGPLMGLDAGVERTMNPILTRVFTSDVEGGDGDGNPDPGETAALYCEYENIGLPAQRLSATAYCGNTYVTGLTGTVSFDSLAAGESRLSEGWFTFQVDPGLDRDPYRAYFVLTLSDGLFFSKKDTIVVGIGDSLGVRDDFESGENGWTHGQYSTADDWHMTWTRTHGGTGSWRCGLPDSSAYSERQDSYLKTPFLISGGGSVLSFYQWLDMENANASAAWDGCVVEISRDNINWHRIAPVGGYPYVFDRRVGGENAGTGCFSGRAMNWERVEFDLADYTGALWVRFRMLTDGSVSGEGWYIDDVVLETSPEPYAVAFEGIVASPGRVEIDWSLEPQLSVYSGREIGLFKADLRSVIEGDYNLYQLIHADTSGVPGVRRFVDTEVEPGVYYGYALRDETYSGEVRWVAAPRQYVPHRITAPGVAACTPNPFRPASGSMAVALEIPDIDGLPASRSGRVMVCDVQGRLLKVLHEGQVLSGRSIIMWDGTNSDGEDLPSGIYIVVFEAGSTPSSQKVVLLR